MLDSILLKNVDLANLSNVEVVILGKWYELFLKVKLSRISRQSTLIGRM